MGWLIKLFFLTGPKKLWPFCVPDFSENFKTALVFFLFPKLSLIVTSLVCKIMNCLDPDSSSIFLLSLLELGLLGMLKLLQVGFGQFKIATQNQFYIVLSRFKVTQTIPRTNFHSHDIYIWEMLL